MIMKMRGDKCHPGRGKRVKIPLLPNNVGKKSAGDAGPQKGHDRYALGFKGWHLFNVSDIQKKFEEAKIQSTQNLTLCYKCHFPTCSLSK